MLCFFAASLRFSSNSLRACVAPLPSAARRDHSPCPPPVAPRPWRSDAALAAVHRSAVVGHGRRARPGDGATGNVAEAQKSSAALVAGGGGDTDGVRAVGDEAGITRSYEMVSGPGGAGRGESQVGVSFATTIVPIVIATVTRPR